MSNRGVQDVERDVAPATATGPEHQARASQSQVTAHFEAESRRWETIYESHDVIAVIHQHRLRMALAWVDAVGLPAGTRVLELGCGVGLAAMALAERGFHVQATDLADVMIERARERIGRAGLADRVTVERADAQDLQYANGSFDVVMALGVLPWMDSPPQATREMARVLRPGGVLVATIGNHRRLPWLLDPMSTPVLSGAREVLKRALRQLGKPWRSPREPPTHPLAEKEWRWMLNDAGLDVVRTTTFGFGPFTFLGHEILPDRVGVSLHRKLQALADRQIAVVRSTGAQHIALARKRSLGEDPT